MTQPLVSVLMSCYNDEAYIGTAIQSILEQSYTNLELLVINDGSTDGTGKILERYSRQDARVRVVHQDNQGLTVSLNRLVGMSRGEFLARLDADDIAYPERLSRQVAYLLRKPQVGVVSCWVQVIAENGETVSCYCHPDDPSLMAHNIDVGPNPLVHSSIMMRKEILNRLESPYRLRFAQDADLWLRLLPYTTFGVVEEVLIVFRHHSQQMSAHNTHMRVELGALIRELHNLRKSGQEEGDWQEKQRQIIAKYRDRSPVPKAVLSSFHEGRAMLRNHGWCLRTMRCFLKSAQSPELRVKSLLYFLLALLPLRLRKQILTFHECRSSKLSVYYFEIEQVITPQQQIINTSFLQRIEQKHLGSN